MSDNKPSLSSAERALKARVSATHGAGAGVDLDRDELRDLDKQADDLMFTGLQQDRDRALKIKSSLRDYQRQQVFEDTIVEAEYQGSKVELNKPIRNSGGKKKFKVYTTHPTTGKVIKVQFGDPNMSIKRDSDERRAAFRKRHGCDALTYEDDRHTPKYWSCRMWEKGSSVTSITEDFPTVRETPLAAFRDFRKRTGKSMLDIASQDASKKAIKAGAALALAGAGYGAVKGMQELGKTKAVKNIRREYQDIYDTLKRS